MHEPLAPDGPKPHTFYAARSNKLARTAVLRDARTLRVVELGMRPRLPLSLVQNVVLHVFVDNALASRKAVSVVTIARAAGLDAEAVSRTMKYFALHYGHLFGSTGYGIAVHGDEFTLVLPKA